MYKKLLWIILIISSLTLSNLAFSAPPYCRLGLNKLVQMINLDSAQKEKIKPILDQLKSTISGARSQMHGLGEQITQQVDSTDMNQGTLDSLISQKVKLIGEMIKAKLMAKHQIFGILNPQQREKLQSMVKMVNDRVTALFKKCHEEE